MTGVQTCALPISFLAPQAGAATMAQRTAAARNEGSAVPRENRRLGASAMNLILFGPPAAGKGKTNEKEAACAATIS